MIISFLKVDMHLCLALIVFAALKRRKRILQLALVVSMAREGANRIRDSEPACTAAVSSREKKEATNYAILSDYRSVPCHVDVYLSWRARWVPKMETRPVYNSSSSYPNRYGMRGIVGEEASQRSKGRMLSGFSKLKPTPY